MSSADMKESGGLTDIMSSDMADFGEMIGICGGFERNDGAFARRFESQGLANGTRNIGRQIYVGPVRKKKIDKEKNRKYSLLDKKTKINKLAEKLKRLKNIE